MCTAWYVPLPPIYLGMSLICGLVNVQRFERCCVSLTFSLPFLFFCFFLILKPDPFLFFPFCVMRCPAYLAVRAWRELPFCRGLLFSSPPLCLPPGPFFFFNLGNGSSAGRQSRLDIDNILSLSRSRKIGSHSRFRSCELFFSFR